MRKVIRKEVADTTSPANLKSAGKTTSSISMMCSEKGIRKQCSVRKKWLPEEGLTFSGLCLSILKTPTICKLFDYITQPVKVFILAF